MIVIPWYVVILIQVDVILALLFAFVLTIRCLFGLFCDFVTDMRSWRETEERRRAFNKAIGGK